MIHIKPFKAWIPKKGFEKEICINTHLDDESIYQKIVDSNPISYLNVVKPHLAFHEAKNPEKHFSFAFQKMNELIEKGLIINDEEECFYIYRQTTLSHQYTCLIAGVFSDDYFDGYIKVHENTITDKENAIIKHIETVGFIGEPILVTHHKNESLKNLILEIILNKNPDVHFQEESGREHQIYRVENKDYIQKLVEEYSKVDSVYIADGHHRSASSCRYFKDKNTTGYFPACIISSEQLTIESFHRIFKDENFNFNSFIENLKPNFEIEFHNNFDFEILKGEFAILTKNKWLKVKTIENSSDLDVNIINDLIFKKCFSVIDAKTDNRISYMRGNKLGKEIEVMIENKKANLIIISNPCKIEDVFEIADKRLVLPPKSTYVKPKLLSGLTVFQVAK